MIILFGKAEYANMVQELQYLRRENAAHAARLEELCSRIKALETNRTVEAMVAEVRQLTNPAKRRKLK